MAEVSYALYGAADLTEQKVAASGKLRDKANEEYIPHYLYAHRLPITLQGRSMLPAWIDSMERAIREMKDWPETMVQVFHHNDADGLTSGAILTRALERQRFKVKRFCLEKPYPALLQKIYEQQGSILIFADFAGRIAPLLSDLNQERNLTLILDHHVAEASTDPRVHNLDPDLFGLKGDRDISGSTTCYHFALALDPANRDLANLAALGAVADGFFVDGRLVNQNREVAMEAVQQGLMEIRTDGIGEQYLMNTSKGQISCADLGDYLDVLGGVGYYQEGPDMGVRVCLEGVSPASDQMVEDLKAVRAKLFNEEIARLQAGAWKQAPHIQWFHVEKRFFPMGVKMIGAFCDAIKDTTDVDSHKYIAGFQIIPDEIPGFQPIKFGDVKISMRVAHYLEGQIRAGTTMGLNVLLPEATGRLGGFSDACHSLTAATTVAVGKEEALIAEMEKILKGEQHG